LGKYFGFGITAKYEMTDGISVGNFAHRANITLGELQPLKDILQLDLHYCSMELESLIGGIIHAGQAIIRTLVKLCEEMDGLEIELLTESGMVTGYACRDAQTLIPHCEHDCSFTMVASPYTSKTLNTNGNYVFEFYCSVLSILQIALDPGTVVYYTGNGIMHRQISLIDLGEDKEHFNFWNLSSYANQQLYSKLLATIKRKLCEIILSNNN
jgi:hypothetical protein